MNDRRDTIPAPTLNESEIPMPPDEETTRPVDRAELERQHQLERMLEAAAMRGAQRAIAEMHAKLMEPVQTLANAVTGLVTRADRIETACARRHGNGVDNGDMGVPNGTG